MGVQMYDCEAATAFLKVMFTKIYIFNISPSFKSLANCLRIYTLYHKIVKILYMSIEFPQCL